MALPHKLPLPPIKTPGSPTSHALRAWEIRRWAAPYAKQPGCGIGWSTGKARVSGGDDSAPEAPGLLCSDFVFHLFSQSQREDSGGLARWNQPRDSQAKSRAGARG